MEKSKIQYGIRKGIILYFDDTITSQVIMTVEDIISEFLTMTGDVFTKKRYFRTDSQTSRYPSGYRNIRGGWNNIFHRAFDNQYENIANESYETLCLADCSTEQLQNVQADICLSNFKRWKKASSELYFLCRTSVSWQNICDFVVSVNKRLNVLYSSIGYEMALNPFCNNDRLYGLRQLKNLHFVNNYETDWLYMRTTPDNKILFPNLLQILSKEMFNDLDMDVSHKDIHLSVIENEKRMIDIFNHEDELKEPSSEEMEERLRVLQKIFQPIILHREKPLYLKPDEWEIRKKRFY